HIIRIGLGKNNAGVYRVDAGCSLDLRDAVLAAAEWCADISITVRVQGDDSIPVAEIAQTCPDRYLAPIGVRLRIYVDDENGLGLAIGESRCRYLGKADNVRHFHSIHITGR